LFLGSMGAFLSYCSGPVDGSLYFLSWESHMM